MSAEQAPLTLRPFRPKRTARGAWEWSKRSAVNRNAPQLGSVEAASVVGADLGVPDVLGGVGGDPAVDVGEPVEAADGGRAPVDRGGDEASCLHGPHVELDLRTGGLQNFESSIGGPLEEPSQVSSVGLEGPAPITGEEGGSCQFGVIDDRVVLWSSNVG